MHCVLCTQLHTLAAKNMAGMVKIIEVELQKKQQMKETIDRMSVLSPFEWMILCGVDGTTCYMNPSGYKHRAEEVYGAPFVSKLSTRERYTRTPRCIYILNGVYIPHWEYTYTAWRYTYASGSIYILHGVYISQREYTFTSGRSAYAGESIYTAGSVHNLAIYIVMGVLYNLVGVYIYIMAVYFCW